MKKRTAIATGVLTMLIVAGGTTGAMSLHRDVTLSVDGQSRSASAFGLTVADVLAANGIALNPDDVVSPPADSAVANGQTIAVRFAKPITLRINGQAHTLVTTATTLDDALDDAPSTVPDISNARLSVPLATPLPRTGLDVTVTTPKTVKLVVHGKKKSVKTTSPTVADLLTEQSVALGEDDKLSPALTTTLTEKLTIKVDEVSVQTKTVTEPIAYGTVTQPDSSLYKGETRTIKRGQDGSAKRTYTITTVNGEVTSKELMKQTVVKEPIQQIVKSGTKTGPALNLARAAMWDRIARCESGNRWNINTGNGYYGGLQFNLPTWRSVNGQQFAARPDLATRAEQITVANRLYAKRGLQPWGCRHAA